MERGRTNRRSGLPAPLRLPAILAGVVVLLLAVWALLPRPEPTPPPGSPDWVTQDLLTINKYSRPGDKLDAVNGLVIHYVGNPGTTAKQNRDYFASLAESGETSVSSNFIVGLRGEVIQAVPSDEVAYASSQRNNDTLSIEVCHPDETGKFNETSYDSLVALVQWLVDYYKLDREQVIRHFDVTGKECPLYYVKNEAAWTAFLDQIDFSHQAKEPAP